MDGRRRGLLANGTYNFDIAAFSQKFIQDIVDAQTRQGAFTNVSPNTLPSTGEATEGSAAWDEGMTGAPGWGDAGIIVPWTTWLQYGDKIGHRKKLGRNAALDGFHPNAQPGLHSQERRGP